MKQQTAKNVHHLVDSPSGDIKALLDRLVKIQTLNNTLQDCLSATFLKHCRVVNLRKNTLVIAVDSPAWSNKLHFKLPDLLAKFRTSGYFGLASIEIIVQPR